MKFFSASTRGFYDPDFHGYRTHQVPDPTWVNPDPEGAPDAQPPLITVPNPACKIPADAVEITDDVYNQLLIGQSQGKVIDVTPDGMPVAVAQVLTLDGMRASVFPEARRLRKDILDALTGIGFRALQRAHAADRGGDTATATALFQVADDADKAQQALLDVTKDPRVLAVTVAQGPEALREVILNVYKERRAMTPASVRSAFNEVAQ